MHWTFGRVILAAILVSSGVGILLLLVYFIPGWVKEDAAPR